MTTEVRAFVCDFCPRKHRFGAKGAATRHELRCYHNPAKQACATCRHLTVPRYEPETGYGGTPECAKDLLPVINGPGEPEGKFRSECSEWESKAASPLAHSPEAKEPKS